MDGGALNPAARLPELFMSIGCSMTVFSGFWLWWFGEDIAARVVRENDFTDPYAVQVWMRRIHLFGAIGVGVLLTFIVARAAIRQQGWRIMFIVVFLGFLVLEVWARITADWGQFVCGLTLLERKVALSSRLETAPDFPMNLVESAYIFRSCRSRC